MIRWTMPESVVGSVERFSNLRRLFLRKVKDVASALLRSVVRFQTSRRLLKERRSCRWNGVARCRQELRSRSLLEGAIFRC